MVMCGMDSSALGASRLFRAVSGHGATKLLEFGTVLGEATKTMLAWCAAGTMPCARRARAASTLLRLGARAALRAPRATAPRPALRPLSTAALQPARRAALAHSPATACAQCAPAGHTRRGPPTRRARLALLGTRRRVCCRPTTAALRAVMLVERDRFHSWGCVNPAQPILIQQKVPMGLAHSAPQDLPPQD